MHIDIGRDRQMALNTGGETRFARSLARRMRDAARALLRTPDPFLNKCREGVIAAIPYHGQFGQDRMFHEELFGDRRGGVFVDIGAHDGVSFNNTLFFEREMGWRGLCVEPIPEVFHELAKNRRAICVSACVARAPGRRQFLRVHGYAEMLSGMVDSYDPRHASRISHEIHQMGGSKETIDVRAVRLDDLLQEHKIESIDLLCIDVEGAELEILSSLALARIRPAVLCVENNYLDPRIWRILRRAGYEPYSRIRQDEIYLARGFEKRPATSVIASVKPGD